MRNRRFSIWVRIFRCTAIALAWLALSTSSALPMPLMANAVGAQKTLVLLPAQSNGGATMSMTEAKALMTQVDALYRRESDNQAWFEGALNPGEKADYFVSRLKTYNPSVCGLSAITAESEAAAGAAGYALTAYRRVLVFSPDQNCRAHGISSIGGRYAIVNGRNQATLRVVGHEIGHSFGFHHAGSEACNASLDCGYQEYGDLVDMMSNNGSESFNAFERERAGWLALNPVGAGDHKLGPFSGDSTTGAKAIKVTVPSTTLVYYVTFRPARGGVYVHRADENNAASSRLICWVTTRADCQLQAGDLLDDYHRSIYIKLVSASATGATVNVSFSHPGLPAGFSYCAAKYQNCTIPAGRSATIAVGAKYSFQFHPNIKGTFGCPQGQNIGGNESSCFMKLTDAGTVRR
jgi:Gametolysin peptidase M11